MVACQAWIDRRLQRCGGNVDQDDKRCQQHHGGLNDGVVAAVNGFDTDWIENS